MTPKIFESLGVGDIVMHKESRESYVVTANHGDRVTAVKTADLTDPHEWDLMVKAELRRFLRVGESDT